MSEFRKLVASFLLVAISCGPLFFLAGCGDDIQERDQGDNMVTVEVRVGDRDVPCILWNDDSYGSGMSCDWSGR